MLIKLLSYFAFPEKVIIVIGSVIKKVETLIPSELFMIKDIIERSISKGYKIKIKNLKFKVTTPTKLEIELRKNTSDPFVFQQIFIDEEFKNVIDIIKKRDIRIQNIIDAGANIGMTTLYLKQHFPLAQVLCIEPDHSNLLQLNRNIDLNNLKSIHILSGGIYSYNGYLSLSNEFRDGLEWSRTLVKTDSEKDNIPVYTLDYLLNKYFDGDIDLLKIDIEGAESNIFSDGITGFLEKTKIITIEVHDPFNVGNSIINHLQKFNFQIYLSGELLIGVKNGI